jgi:hypothetical protein
MRKVITYGSRRSCRIWTNSGKGHDTDAPEQEPAVFNLIGHEAFVGKAAAIVATHHVGAADFFELAEGGADAWENPSFSLKEVWWFRGSGR